METNLTTEQLAASWTIFMNDSLWAKAEKCCRGCYQRNFLLGNENLSGSTLRGKAKQYGDRYARSRAGLLDRMSEAGIPWREMTGPHNRRVLVIG